MKFSKIRTKRNTATEKQKVIMRERTIKIIDKLAPMDNFVKIINAQLSRMNADSDLFIENIPCKNRLCANWRFNGCIPYTYAFVLESAGICKAKYLRPDIKPEHIISGGFYN